MIRKQFLQAAGTLFALCLFVQACAPPPSPEERAADLRQDARSALEYGNQKDALETYREAVELFPEDVESRLGIAEIQIRRRRFTDAAKTLLETRPLVKTAKHWAALGKGFRAARLPDEAGAAYQKAISLAPENPAYQVALGNLYVESGRTDSAAAAYRRAASLNPDQSGVQEGLGRCFARSGRLDSAAARFHRALAQSPDNPDLLCEYADARLRLGALEDALAALRRSVKSDPYHIQTRYLLGRACAAAGKPSEAGLHLDVFQRQKELAGRIHALENTAAERPSAETFQTLSYLYRQRGLDSLAKASLQRATNLNPMLTAPQETGHNGAF